ncbi:MAG: hypothetical protein NWF07_08345 [Candidatus Bathyarchaeota archaeon]|nr:hypothetical protein [Candidatus Bathyarchaeota archaeon]
METLRKHRVLLALSLLLVSIIILYSGLKLKVQTDKPSYMINETITAELTLVNQMPFPLPYTAYTKIDAEVYVNGEKDNKGWGAFVTPASQIFLVPRGEHNIFMPIKYTPKEAGVVEFVFKIYSSGGVKTIRKMVEVVDS